MIDQCLKMKDVIVKHLHEEDLKLNVKKENFTNKNKQMHIEEIMKLIQLDLIKQELNIFNNSKIRLLTPIKKTKQK